MIKSAKAFGIVPADLLVAGAMSEALEDLRRNPWLLDYCFNWYSGDELTAKFYGDSAKMRAKEWFLKHKISIVMSTMLVDPKFPLISINLQSAVDDVATIGDVNMDPTESLTPEQQNVQPQVILGPFTVSDYDSVTGLLTFPTGVTTANVYEGQIIVDTKSNIGYTILAVNDENSIVIETDLNANFTNCYIAPIDSFYVTSLESMSFRHTYTIKCIAQSEPLYASYLHAVVRFILLRYKQTLLEDRGFDRTTIISGGIYEANPIIKVENTFAQDITLTGYVREYWPKIVSSKFQGVKLYGIEVIGGSATPLAVLPEYHDQGWGNPGDFT